MPGMPNASANVIVAPAAALAPAAVVVEGAVELPAVAALPPVMVKLTASPATALTQALVKLTRSGVTVSVSDALLHGGLATLQVGSVTPAGVEIVAVLVTDVWANAWLAENANKAVHAKNLS